MRKIKCPKTHKANAYQVLNTVTFLLILICLQVLHITGWIWFLSPTMEVLAEEGYWIQLHGRESLDPHQWAGCQQFLFCFFLKTHPTLLVIDPAPPAIYPCKPYDVIKGHSLHFSPAEKLVRSNLINSAILIMMSGLIAMISSHRPMGSPRLDPKKILNSEDMFPPQLWSVLLLLVRPRRGEVWRKFVYKDPWV